MTAASVVRTHRRPQTPARLRSPRRCSWIVSRSASSTPSFALGGLRSGEPHRNKVCPTASAGCPCVSFGSFGSFGKRLVQTKLRPTYYRYAAFRNRRLADWPIGREVPPDPVATVYPTTPIVGNYPVMGIWDYVATVYPTPHRRVPAPLYGSPLPIGKSANRNVLSGGFRLAARFSNRPNEISPGAGNRALLGVAPPLSHAVTQTHGFRPPLARPMRSGERSMRRDVEGPTVGSDRELGIQPKAPPLPSGFSGRRARRDTPVPPYRRSLASTNFGKCVSPFSDWRHTSVRAPRYPVPIKRPFLDPLSVREGPRKDLILYVLNFLRVLPPIRAVPGRSGSFRGGHGRLNAPGARPSASFTVLPSIFAGGT